MGFAGFSPTQGEAAVQALTTAMQSGASTQFVQATAGFNGTNCSGTFASNSVSVSVGNYITTAALSQNTSNYAGINSAVTGALITVNTSGVSINVGSAFVAATAGFNGTSCSGTISSNSFSVSIGAYITTAALSGVTGSFGTMSYYQNIPILNTSALTQTSGSSVWLQPFNLPQAVSLSYVRFLASYNDSAVGTAGTTSANTTFTCAIYTTFGLVVYSAGTGASSRSLQSIGSTTVGMTGLTQYSAGAQGSQYTMTLQKTYPDLGATNSNYTTSYAVTSASIVISSNSNTLFTGLHFLDLAWATSFTAGNYWLGLGASSSSASQTSHISFCGTDLMPISMVAVSLAAVTGGRLGQATSASDQQLMLGLGAWTTNASVAQTASIALSQVSQVASNPMLPFQFVRQA